jgi:NAD(P)H dehydrogenase (quinone)
MSASDAAVAARVLREGPDRHGGVDYWKSTEALSGSAVASIMSDVLGTTIECNVREPAEFEALFKAGSLSIENWYAKGAVDFCVQGIEVFSDQSPILLR